MKLQAYVGVLGLAILSSTPVMADVVGRASVIDGDTFEIRGEKIRLWGVDAPEGAQSCTDGAGRQYRCGQRAALALATWIAGRNLQCR